jgi:uncharacterized protein (TIGR00661 family)
MQPKPLHILISPLDWGLGHASRCVPVINQLINAGHKVTLAGYGRSIILLQKEFPDLESIELQGFSPSYSETGNMAKHLLMLLPQFIGTIFREHRELKKLISQYHFDIVISDNRYGLWNNQISSILITHQVMIKTPAWLRFAEYQLYRVSRLLISRFDECWIPDYKESPGLSGDLSHKYPLPGNAKFIGPLSRFEQSEPPVVKKPGEGQLTAIISGPEPQRSIFQEIVTRQLTELNKPATLISGKPESGKGVVFDGELEILPHLPTKEMSSLITSSLLVISRSGYSSIMDMNALGAKALFIPTPGQTEQVYLAELHQIAGTALWQKQELMNLNVDIENALKYFGFKKNISGYSISSAVAELKKK